MTCTANDTRGSTMNYALVSGAVVDVGEAETTPPHKIQSSLTTIFEQYAQHHPNPKLAAEEYQQRDALLQQVAASQQVPLVKKKKSGGLFGFLFNKKARHDESGADLYDTSGLNESEWLEYYNDDEDSEAEQQDVLCDSTLDTSCIPQEAYAMARFLLTCRRNVPNVARSDSSIITLVNVGIICQLSEEGESIVLETSDCQALQAQIPSDYDVSWTRAVVLGEGMLAVSWGLPDGIVVVYQRNPHSWDSVAVISPTRAVSDNMHHAGSSNAMIVTDLVPLMVQDPNDANGVVTTLAISRLGGYIEFIIVPPLPKHRQHKRKKRGRPDQHYASDLPNISFSDTGMTALTTADYHVDVLCLEAYRTKVGSDTEWDTDLFPKTPPAEYVLGASGGTKDGQQVISFWGVSIVFPENVGEERASIHVSFLDGINLGTVGADVTVFASDKMWSYWRRPRGVRLRLKEACVHEVMEDGETNEAVKAADVNSLALVDGNTASERLPLSTLSTPMPIMRMRLTPKDSKPEVVLAAVDGNGGISFIDCTAVIALAAHDVAEDELGDNTLLNLKCKLPSKSLPSTVDIGWLRAGESRDIDREGGDSPSVLLAVVRSRMLQIVDLSLPPQLGGVARVSYSLDIPSMLHGATVIGSSKEQSVSFAAFKSTEARRKLLCQEILERLDSSTVIVMLVKASKYAEAIAAAQTMNVSSSGDAIQFCHRKVWEQDGNVEHLSAVIDDDYVVNETMAIFDSGDRHRGIDLASARAACLLALERATSSKERAEDVVLRLEALEAKVSTYILLCMSNEAIPQLLQFREKFLPVPLREVASAFASKGDISSLTTILFRHRPELLPCQLEILDKLSLETPPESYAHLLPVSRLGRSCFHTGEHGVGGLRQWSLMAHYMESTYGMRLLLDDKDQAVILDRCRLFDDEQSTLQVASIKDWYLTRAKRIQSEIGSVLLLRDFLEMASQRLGVSFDTIPAEDVDPVLQELCSIYSYAMQLNQISTETISASESRKLAVNDLATMTLSEIGEMSVDDRVSLILGPASDPSAILSKFWNGSTFLTLGGQSDEQRERMIDSSVAAYCGNAISNSVGENGTSVGSGLQQAVSLRNALDICTEISNASRTTIRRSNRVIRDKVILMNLVLSAAYGTSRACKVIDLLPSDCRHMVESIWESYECLPASLSPDDKTESNVQAQVDGLYKNLVVVDVFSRWSPSALSFLVNLNRTENMGRGEGARAEVGLTVVTEMCHSFCHRIQGAAPPETELDLLRDLISDFDQVEMVGFDGMLPLSPTVQESLIKPLLKQKKFHLIDPLANWTSRDDVQATVLAFVSEAMFSNDEALSQRNDVNGDSVQAVISCQDILGPLFPKLQAEFESSRRYLDAAFFINRMMVGSDEFTYPSEVRDKLPLDIIETVLSQNPGCILDGCSEWNDITFSRKANETICRHYWSLQQVDTEDSSPANGAALPVLPGSAIYHLASLLGLQGPQSLLVVKSRVVYYAITLSEFAAAAAVCATMVYENGSSWNEPGVANCIVDAVARVVSLNNYDDMQMKHALCNAVFQRCRGEVSVLDIHAYETVLDSFVNLENTRSRRRGPQQSPTTSPVSDVRGSHAQGDMEPAVSDFLVFRAVGMVAKTAKNVARHAHHPANQSVSQVCPPPSLSDRVYKDILTQYSTDIRELFWILRGVSASNKVDDPLLLTLGRLLGFWCIADALRMRPQGEPLESERAALDGVLSLGVSLLLHTQDREALVSCIGELQGILSRETVATMERAALVAQPDSVTPDFEIVRTLISRGYSENGARRAAIMTGNESAQVALVWAVSHTLDDGFDDPMVSVASANGPSVSGRVDQSMVHCLQETLSLANSYVSRKRTLQSLLPATKSLSNLFAETAGVNKEQNAAQNGHRKPTMKAVRVQTKETTKTKCPSKYSDGHDGKIQSDAKGNISPASAGKNETKAATPVNVVAVPQFAKTRLASSMPKQNVSSTTDTGAAKTSSSVTARKLVPPKPKVAPPPRPTALKATVPPSNKAARATPSAPKASISADRLSTLRSHDKTNLAGDERQRLIAEGRRMLREARASKTSTKPASTTTTTTSAPASTDRYPLRSRTPPLSGPTITAQTTTEASNAERPQPPAPPTENVSKQEEDNDSDGSGWDFDDF